jgi:hypothetical protein
MSVFNKAVQSLHLDDLDAIRLIKFSDSNKVLGITNQLGHNWLWQNKYPIPVRKCNGCNYVRYSDLINHLNSLFDKEEQSLSTDGLYSNKAPNAPILVKGGAS